MLSTLLLLLAQVPMHHGQVSSMWQHNSDSPLQALAGPVEKGACARLKVREQHGPAGVDLRPDQGLWTHHQGTKCRIEGSRLQQTRLPQHRAHQGKRQIKGHQDLTAISNSGLSKRASDRTCSGTVAVQKSERSVSVSPEEPGPSRCTISACARRITGAGTHTRTCVHADPSQFPEHRAGQITWMPARRSPTHAAWCPQ